MATNGYALSNGANGDVQYGATSSQSPPKPQNANPAVHQRTYQACIPCRQRKVRCDLGSVDNPHDPPCTRCRREAKECYFSATRRKKKTQNGDNTASEAGDEPVYEIRHNRKRLRTSEPPPVDGALEDDEYPEQPRTPGGSIGRTQPLRRPTAPQPIAYREEDEKQAEHTAFILQQSELHGGHDALKVLYQAGMASLNRSDSTSSGIRPSFVGLAAGSQASTSSPILNRVPTGTSYTNGPLAPFQNDGLWKTPTDGAAPANSIIENMPVDNASYAEAIKAWTRFKFVRAGWMTAKEGVDYILYFYRHLSPLTPVAIPDFKHPSTHKNLLEEEPMLAVTMLLIASRHMKLDGPGSHSRPYAIHQKLWTYLSGMINRVVWGQEQFGGGFCGAGGPGAQPGCDVNPLLRKGLRTLGSVESLVLLTEWHPRAMHFPPDEDDDDLMVPEQAWGTPAIGSEDGVPKGIGGHRMDAWLEPCWRSDRMCWMLLGMAMSLAMEIGVFDSSEWQRHARATDGHSLSAEDLTKYDKRRGNVRDLLLVYVTQTSGRVGLTSMLPGYYSKPEDSDLFRRRIDGQQDSINEITFHFWLRMAALMREGNNKIFANKTFTRDLIRNGDYKRALDQFAGPLNEWKKDFDDCVSIPQHMRAILGIEYEYCRCYINALALQAVAERCANDHPSPVQPIDPPLEMARAAVADANSGPKADFAIAPSTLSKWLGGDRNYMVTVGDAARNLLKIVVDDLEPDGFLRHAPVRTYFRIISVAIMLLKSFALGATEADVTDSLKLMERTVSALRGCIVDDVHVASRFADLLDTLSQNLRPRLVRIAADGRAGKSRRESQYNVGLGPNTGIQYSNTRSTVTQSPQTVSGAMQNGQGWNNNFNMVSPSATMTSGTATYGISNETYDLMGGDNQYSVMPPPGFSGTSPTNTQNINGPGSANGSTGSYEAFPNGNFDNPQDWLALPLDPILNMSGADVDQTMYGPQLGGHDMLEYLLGPQNTNGY
ncbi:hypothetical protein AC578_10956 [Pseudocercospora eumusae]|uniref:Zn(2)-C6 fungal-type domain-containing protein n=1 Tax=Pseudocercospora eumusae TaxID=321146 RepID=A0A139HS60_9PEZI|nr:hypothetical protein AC578_10956 [Pseudocercospora eumusae]